MWFLSTFVPVLFLEIKYYLQYIVFQYITNNIL